LTGAIHGSRVLVTGGAGFLGSHLCERLLADGHQVQAVDNFYTGSRDNVAHLLENPRFSVLEHDVTNPLDVDGEVDQIFNLACPASPPHYQRDPIKTTLTSVLGVYNMLELARRTGAKILQASTSEVYGDPSIHPQPESYWGNVNPIGIRSCYDEGKRVAETLLFDFNRQYGIPIKVVRIFNTYGPRMDPEDGRVVSNFIVQALRGQDLTIYGDGTQTRSFCFVDDLVEGFVRFMATSDDVIGPINLGNTGEFTVSELAEKIIAKVGGPSRIVYRELPSDDPKVRKPDTTKARAVLGWEAKVALDEGLDKTIAYFAKVVTP
jgi:UDP-glucuronate decarboxylase